MEISSEAFSFTASMSACNLRAELGKLGGVDTGNEFLDVNSHDGSSLCGGETQGKYSTAYIKTYCPPW